MTVRDLLLLLPRKGWGVVRDVPPMTLVMAMYLGYVKVQRSGPAPKTYQIRLTGAGRRAREGSA